MKVAFALLITAFVMILGFQNCSATHDSLSEDNSALVRPFNFDDVYPYETIPDYYHDAQLIGNSENGGVVTYQFIASVVDIESPENNIEVRIEFLQDNGNILCPGVLTTVNRSTNHIELPDCASTAKPDTIEIRMTITGEAEPLIPIVLDLAGG